MKVPRSILIASLAALAASGCSGEASEDEKIWGEDAAWGKDAEKAGEQAANSGTEVVSEEKPSEPQATAAARAGEEPAPSGERPSDPVYFYCEPTPEGRNFFFVDPDDTDRGFAGFEYSPAYQESNPDETPPITELTAAITGSGMRYTNGSMEFVGKADDGMLTLSDGTTVRCSVEQ